MAENLYCPRCAKAFTTDTSYCRTCGLALDKIAGIVSGDAENAPVTVRRPNFNLIRYGVVLFIFGLVIGLVNGILRDFELYPDRFGKMIFLAFIAVAMLTMGSAFVFQKKVYKKRKGSASPVIADEAPAAFQTAPLMSELPAPDTNEFINPVIDFPANTRKSAMAEPGSVTERTTRNLE